jgi:hemerythrin-like metal-binding protein
MSEEAIRDLPIAFETGVEEIDSQHLILISTLNKASERLADDMNGELFSEITRDLLAYAIYHFETEEDLMKRYNYGAFEPTDAEEHIRQHREFSSSVVELRSKKQAHEPGSSAKLIGFLRDWLVNHICTTDKRLGRFIVKQLKNNKD